MSSDDKEMDENTRLMYDAVKAIIDIANASQPKNETGVQEELYRDAWMSSVLINVMIGFISATMHPKHFDDVIKFFSEKIKEGCKAVEKK